MIYLNLIGHDFRYEVQELIKLFFFKEDIIFIEDVEEYPGSGIFIQNILEQNERINSITKVYKDNKLIFEYTEENLQNVEIGQGDFKKKLRIGTKKKLI